MPAVATPAAGNTCYPGVPRCRRSKLPLWRQTNFDTYDHTGSAADDADVDLDGLINRIDYALGLNPTQPSTTGLPSPFITGEPGSRHLALDILLPAVIPPEVKLEVFGGNDLTPAPASPSVRPAAHGM